MKKKNSKYNREKSKFENESNLILHAQSYMKACQTGDAIKLKELLDCKTTQTLPKHIFQEGLNVACFKGYNDIVHVYFHKKIKCSWTCALCEACKGNQLNTIDKIIDMIKMNGYQSYQGVLNYACYYNHWSLVQKIQLKIKNLCTDPSDCVHVWQAALFEACKGGHEKMADYVISNGATDMDLGLFGCCEGGHPLMAQKMIDQGANEWNIALKYACLANKTDMIIMMFSKGADDYNLAWRWAFSFDNGAIMNYLLNVCKVPLSYNNALYHIELGYFEYRLELLKALTQNFIFKFEDLKKIYEIGASFEKAVFVLFGNRDELGTLTLKYNEIVYLLNEGIHASKLNMNNSLECVLERRKVYVTKLNTLLDSFVTSDILLYCVNPFVTYF